MTRKIDYATMERQDAVDPAPVGHYWVRDIDGSNRRLVTFAQYRAEVEASKTIAMANFRRASASIR